MVDPAQATGVHRYVSVDGGDPQAWRDVQGDIARRLPVLPVDSAPPQLSPGQAQSTGPGVADFHAMNQTPLLLQDWETGAYDWDSVLDVVVTVPRPLSNDAVCTWTDICFCGEQSCRFPKDAEQ